MTKSTPIIFCDNRMYSQGARAASVLSTESCFLSFEKWYHVFNGLKGLKVPLLVYTNHINNEKHVHHGFLPGMGSFLAPRPYLCSTSLHSRHRPVNAVGRGGFHYWFFLQHPSHQTINGRPLHVIYLLNKLNLNLFDWIFSTGCNEWYKMSVICVSWRLLWASYNL